MKLFFSFLIILLSSCVTSANNKELKAEKGVVVSYINSGQLSSALKQLRDMLKRHPKDAEVHNLMGLVQLSLRNFSSAIDSFDKSYALDPKPLAALNKASALIELGRHGEARKILVGLIKDKSEKAYLYKERLYHNLAYSYQKVQKYKLAIKIYNRALKENPTYHMSWLNKGVCYEKLSDVKRALYSFGKAKTNCRGCYEPVTLIVDAYIKLNKIPNAKKELESFLKMQNTDPQAVKLARERLNTLGGGNKQ